MRRKPLTATVLLSAVAGTVLLALAPSAAADPGSGSEGSPGNRGWVVESQHDSSDSSDSSDSDSDD